MPETQPDIYLASRSPRRRELLRQIGIRFEAVGADVDETPKPDEDPLDYVRRIAGAKARKGLAAGGARPVLGADTAVVLEREIFGKPASEADAVGMLLKLSGRTHEVLSAVALAYGDRVETRVQLSRVSFAPISEAVARAYWATGEPADKAGAYAIQGRAAAFITHLEGSYSGVMGLPLYETADLCRRFGIPVLAGPDR